MGSIFHEFSWFEIWGPVWLLVIIGVAFLYNKHIVSSPEFEVGANRVRYFYSGLILLYLFNGSPFSVIADHYLFSALVLQLSMTYFVAIPLLIVGLPFEWFKKYAWNHKLRLSMKIAGQPWLTLIIFNTLFTIYFLPGAFNAIHSSILLSFSVKTVLLIYSFFMWWAIINPVPRLNDLRPIIRIAYIFFASVLLFPIGFYLIVVLQAHYPVYAEAAGNLIPAMTAIYDQQLAGGILKLIQLSSFIFAMYMILRQWFTKEEAENGHPYDKNFRVVQGVVIRLDDKKD